MVKINALRALALAGLMVSVNGLRAEDIAMDAGYTLDVAVAYTGNPTPEVLARIVQEIAQEAISERDAVLSIARTYASMGNDYVQMIDDLKAADSQITKIEDREQFLIDSFGKFALEMMKIQKNYALTEAIAQTCLTDDGMLDEIGRLLPIKIQELLSVIQVELPDSDQEFVVCWYEVLEYALTVALHEVISAALTTHYPQYAQEAQALLNVGLQPLVVEEANA